jgi:hypothetical protein
MDSLPRGARPAMLLAIGLSTFGIVGMGLGVTQLQSRHVESDLALQAQSDEAVPQATLAFGRELNRVIYKTSIRKALALANILASLLLVIASGAVALRRRSARWWVTQAVIANIVWTCGNVVGTIIVLREASHDLGPLFREHMRVSAEAAGDVVPPGLNGDEVLYLFGSMVVLSALIAIPAYLLMYRLSRRDDVGSFLAEHA